MKIKKILTSVLFTFSFLILISQEYKQIGSVYEYSLISQNGKIGLADEDRVLIPLNNYTNIEYDTKFNLYKCYKEDEFEIFFYDFKRLNSDYLFTKLINTNSELIKVQGKDGYGFIYNYELVVPPIYDKITVEIETYFENGYNLILEKDGLIGINLLEKTNAVEVVYEKIYSVKNTNLYIVQKDGKVGLMNPSNYLYKNIIVLPTKYDEITRVQGFEGSSTFFVTKSELTGVFNSEFEAFVLPMEFSALKYYQYDYQEIFANYPGFFIGEKGNKVGAVTYEFKGSYGEEMTTQTIDLIPFVYDNLDLSNYSLVDESSFSYMKIPAEYHSIKGDIILPDGVYNSNLSFPSFVKSISLPSEGFFIIEDTLNKYSIWQSSFVNYMHPEKYDNLEFIKGYPLYDLPFIVKAELDNRSGFLLFEYGSMLREEVINENGEKEYKEKYEQGSVIFVSKYDFINQELLVLTSFNNKCGLVNTLDFDKFIISQEYDEIELYQGDYFLVKQNQKWGLIDYYGKVLKSCEYEKKEDVLIDVY